MKRKRGSGRRKPQLTPVVDANEPFPNNVCLNTQDDLGIDDFYNAEFDSRTEIETPQNGSNRSREKVGLQKQKVVDVTVEHCMSSFPETNVAVPANLSKKARSIMTKSSRGFVSSSVEPSSTADQAQGRRMCQKEPNLPQQDPQYKEQELKAALAVIRKVMKMDAAEPFNVPVDPIALGIPDYFDVIDTPMDFGTICSNLESGVKYKNSKDVLGDVQYIWDNCCKYNKKGHYILELMKRVKKNFVKFWTEAGLHREQQQEIDGHKQLPSTKSTSVYGHRNPLGSMNDYAEPQQQDQADPSRLHPHQSSLSYSQSYQPQQPCPCHLSSGQQQNSHPQAGENFGRAGHSHLIHTEASVRRSPCGNICPVDLMDGNSTHPQQKQIGPSKFQLQQHEPSLGYSEPYHPHQRIFQCEPSSQQPHQFHQQAGTCLASARCSHLPPPMETTMRRSPHEHGCPVGPMANNPTCSQQNQTGQCQPQHHHHPSVSCSQPYQAQQGSCQCLPTYGQQQPSQVFAGTNFANAGDFCSSPPVESMIRCTKRGPKHPVGPMTDCISHQKNSISPSHMQACQPSSGYGQEHDPQKGTCRIPLSSGQPHPSFCQSHPSQPHAGMEMGGAEEHVHSPPPAESMIRCTKHGPPSCPTVPMTDYISHHQDWTPSQTQPLQISLSHNQPRQPQQGTSHSQLSSSQPQPSQLEAGMNMGGAECSSVRKKTRGRGPTRCLKIWNTEGKIPISTNELGQPIGLEAPKLINFLGTLARNGHITPLNYIDWRAFPDENKERLWQQVQSKFDIEPKSKSWVLKSVGNKWKNWKANLKATRYSPHETDEERLADCDERVLPDQWRILVSFWNSKEAKERSVTNKASRAQQKTIHTTGTKSFARVREEQRMKSPDGKEPSRADLFIMTRTRKNGRPVNEATSVIISKLREGAAQQNGPSQNGMVGDDVFFQVMGQDRPGRVRTYGLGPAPSDLGGPKPSRDEAIKMVSEAKVEVQEMKEKMVAVEQTCAQMAAQMATMMSMMQRKFSDKHLPDGSPSEPHVEQVADVSSNSEGSQRQQVHSTPFYQGVASLQRSAVKRGKKQNKSTGKVTRQKK